MNISGRKGSAPPSRPPPPKTGAGGGISFSFKALEEGDDSDDDLTVYTGKFDKQVHDEKERQARAQDKERSHSKSPEIRPPALEKKIHKSPSVKSQNSLEKLIDFKDKVQDTLVKKKEELESFVSSKEKDKESANISGSPRTSSLDGDSEQFISLEDSTNEPVESDNLYGQEFGMDTEYFEVRDESEIGADELLDEDEILEINEEYFNPNAEDFSELPGVQPMLRQRKRLQKFRKIKPIVPPAPVSMSKLNQKGKEERPVSLPDDHGTTAKDNIEEKKKQTENTSESVIHINGTKIPIKKVIGGVVVLFLYLIIPFPSYISGLIAGVILSSGGWMLYLWVTEPPKPRETIPEDPPLDQLPPLPVPEMRDPKGEDGFYKGWMNELADYQPDSYSINQTHSIYIHLEGTTLRLRRPKINIAKRAMWDEPKVTNPQFIHQRHFDIEGSKVLLLPPGLIKKRLWSKKYPICVALAKAGQKKTDSAPQTPVTSSGLAQMKNSNSADTVQGFEMVSETKCDSSVLYLFARTCQEKEQWYRRLSSAANGIPLKNHILEIRRLVESSMRLRRSSSSDSLRHRRQNSSDSLSSVTTTSSNVDDTQPSGNSDLKDFIKYMSRLIPRDPNSSPSSPVHSLGGKEKETKSSETKPTVATGGTGSKSIVCDTALLPLNALLGRCFYDFLGDQYWAEKVKDKLQKKLSKIHIPYFIEELQVSEISLGSEVPVIRRANKPYLDENGFWIDLDVTYSGKFNMTIETKVNLLKLKQSQPATKPTAEEKTEKKKSAVTDSEEEDSAESSTDEEEEASNIAEDGTQSGGTGKKIMKYINKIAASKYFQSATENKYIKKAMTGVSNTRLILTVEVQKLSGTLAINIPTPPSDRLWYGFRGNPQLWLVAKPKVGEREVTMSHITEWIEKKLALEFQHVLVMPNMDDLVIPILSAGSDVDSVTEQQPSGTEL